MVRPISKRSAENAGARKTGSACAGKDPTRRSPGTHGQAARNAYQLRIVGGRWRGRRLSFPAIDAIRPSPDRVRETLFNWLQAHIVGACCLDLFAGSGALGFEALSRGAAHVCFVDREVRIGRYLHDTLQRLECPQASVHVEEAGRFLRRAPQPFDIVFLDPPFDSAALPEVCGLLAQGWLAPQAWIYIECPADTPLLPPPSWQVYRSRRAGQVGYHLLRTGLPRTGRISNPREVTS